MKLLLTARLQWCLLAMLCLLGAGCRKAPEDEAKLAGLTTADFPQVTADIFQPMDGGMQLAPNEIMGRHPADPENPRWENRGFFYEEPASATDHLNNPTRSIPSSSSPSASESRPRKTMASKFPCAIDQSC